ncbi:MAG: hypothetical protein DRI86_09375 [Bacteroidetes bacterium]|nr:MAG: hypothetical protein DRI86_09375 [Bacteroidota bacterium]
MVMRSKILFLIGLLPMVVVLFLSGCEQTVSDEDCDTYNYYDCNTVEPFEAELKMKFTISKNIHSVAFEIYKGGFDENNIIVYDTALNSTVTYNMPIPEYYSVRAIYKLEDKILYTIDGVKMDKKSIQKCDSLCWKEANKELDLTIH